jgi:hypothetical protein
MYERTGVPIEIGFALASALHTGTAGSNRTGSWQPRSRSRRGAEPGSERCDHLVDPSCTTLVDEIVDGVMTPKTGRFCE